MSHQTALTVDPKLKTPLVEFLLSVADDKFMLGHRVGDWTGLAPILEEDIAFSSISQDELAHAQALYELVGELMGRRADDVAFGRAPAAYRCAAIVTWPDDLEWDAAIVRQFYCDRFDLLRLERMSRSALTPLAELSARLLAEERLHVEHADGWVRHLGAAGGEAAERMQRALERLAPRALTLFEPTAGLADLEAARIYPKGDGDMFAGWRSGLAEVTAGAGLALPALKPIAPAMADGRSGRHEPHFAALLDELCEVYRLEPGASW